MAGFGGAVKLKGETEYRKALKDITTNLTVLASEMKVVNSVYDKNDTSTTALEKRNKTLNKTLDEQTKKLNEAKKMLNEAKSSTDSNATTVAKWQNEVNKAQAQVNKTTSELNKNNEAIKNNASLLKQSQTAYSSLTSKINEQEKKLQELKVQYSNTILEQGKGSKEAKSLSKEIKTLSSDLNENKTKLENVENASNKFDKSLSNVQNSTKKTSNVLTSFNVAIGNLISNGINKVSSAITGQLDSAISRVDTIHAYERTMKNLGFANDEVTNATNKLKKGIEGLPTTLPGIISMQQRYTALRGSIDEATNLTIALNNATLAGGQGQEIANGAMEQWYQIIANGKPDLQSWRIISSAMPAQLNQIAEAVMGSGKKSQDLFDAWKNGKVTTEQIVKALINLNSQGTGSLASFSEQAQGSSSGINTSMANIKTAITNGLAEIIESIGAENITNFLDNVKKGIKEVIPIISNAIQFIIDNKDNIISAIAGIGGALAVIKIGEFVVGIVGLVTKIKEASTVFAGLKLVMAGIGGPITLIIAAIVGIVAAIVTLWNTNEGFRNAVIGAWNKIKEVAVTVWGAVADFFTKTIPEAWENAKAILQTAWDYFDSYVLEPIRNGLYDIGQFFMETIPNAISNAITTVQETLASWGQNIATFFTETIPEMWQSLLDWFANLPYAIGFAIGEALGKIILWGIEVWSYLSTNVPIWIENVGTFFSELPGKIATWLLDTFNKIVQFGVNSLNKAVEIGSNFINNIISFFMELPGKVLAFLTNALNNIITWGSNIVNKAVEIGTNFINNIISFFRTLPVKIAIWLLNTISKVIEFKDNLVAKGKQAGSELVSTIINAITSLPEKMMDMGKNIVEGLWNGIQNAKNWIKDKVGDFARGILDGMKNALGIHSPSKLFEVQVGKNVALGIGEGFENTMADVNKQMANAIQTDYDLNVSANVNGSGSRDEFNYFNMLNAFKEALREVKVIMDDREMGTFVTDTMERVVYN